LNREDLQDLKADFFLEVLEISVVGLYLPFLPIISGEMTKMDLTIDFFSAGYGKYFYFLLTIINEIENSINAEPYPVTFPAFELFNPQRARVFFQGNKGIYDFVVNPVWETL
jgi:hypothetical protein